MLLSGVAAGRARPGGCTRRVFDIVSAHAGTGGGGGFYHPAHRRRGYFKALCARAARCRAAGIPEFLFAVEPRSAGGAPCWRQRPAVYGAIRNTGWNIQVLRRCLRGRLALQRVDADGAEPYRLFLENDMGEADVDNYVAASVENPERAAYLAMLDGAPVGMFHINLGEHPGRAFLYGVRHFARTARPRGWGRS